jgi:hypothetical protein
VSLQFPTQFRCRMGGVFGHPLFGGSCFKSFFDAASSSQRVLDSLFFGDAVFEDAFELDALVAGVLFSLRRLPSSRRHVLKIYVFVGRRLVRGRFFEVALFEPAPFHCALDKYVWCRSLFVLLRSALRDFEVVDHL